MNAQNYTNLYKYNTAQFYLPCTEQLLRQQHIESDAQKNKTNIQAIRMPLPNSALNSGADIFTKYYFYKPLHRYSVYYLYPYILVLL